MEVPALEDYIYLVDVHVYRCRLKAHPLLDSYKSLTTPISAATFCTRRQESSMRDLQTDFVRALATFRQWQGLH